MVNRSGSICPCSFWLAVVTGTAGSLDPLESSSTHGSDTLVSDRSATKEIPIYLAQAILRKRQKQQSVNWTQEEVWIADNTATMSLALVPLALGGTSIQDMPMFLVNLGFVALFAAAYGGLIHWGDEKGKYSFALWEVACLGGLYVVYLEVIFVDDTVAVVS